MDATSSIITIVAAVFTLAVRLKNLTKDTRAHQEDVERLQHKAEEHARLIQAARNLKEQGRPPNDWPVHTDKDYVEQRLATAGLSFENDFKQFKKELLDLEREGTRQKVDLLLWGKSRVAPAIEKIKARVEAHERDLGNLMHIHNGIALQELTALTKQLSPLLPSGEFEEFSPRVAPLQPTPTIDSEITLIGGPSPRTSFSVPKYQAGTDLPEKPSSPVLERVKSKDRPEISPLLRAVSKGDKAEVGMLLDDGADVQARDKGGRTVLHLAMQKPNNEALILSLLKRNLFEKDKLDLNAVDDEGNTALHLCADWNKGSIAKMLLEHGAIPGVRDGSGKTPMFYAIEKGYYEVVEVLLEGEVEVTEEYLSMNTSSHIKNLLRSKSKSRRCSESQPETRRRNSRKMSFLRRGSSVNV